MPNHTPGPWKVDIDSWCVDIAPHRYIQCEGRSASEARANTYLIAAAPDLLETLKDCERELSWCVDGMGRRGGEYERVRNKARSAIAKAEGRLREDPHDR